MFTHKDYAIYALDDYSVHLQPEVKAALLKQGYIYVGIGGGITGDMQISDTDLHAPLKAKYRELETNLMLQQLRKDPHKIPRPDRDDMMSMLTEAMGSVQIDVNARMKNLWLTNALDGSEDYLVSERIFTLVGNSLINKRESLMNSPSPRTLKELVKRITPPRKVYEEKIFNRMTLHQSTRDTNFLIAKENLTRTRNYKSSWKSKGLMTSI